MADICTSLTNNHLAMSRLSRRIHLASDRELRNALFDDLAKALGGHFSAIEQVVLPALFRSRAQGLSSDVLIAHMNLKQSLALLLATGRKSERFEQRLKALCDEVEAQADREQLALLPFVRTALLLDEQTLLGEDVEWCMRSRLGDHPVLHAAADLSPPPRGLVAEAKVVLASLAPDDAGTPQPAH